MPSPRLTPEEKLRRRNERLRLIAYLHRGGRLVREDLPAGVVAWAKASRSGPCFSDRSVTRLRKRGCVIRGDKWDMITALDGSSEHLMLALRE